MGLELQVQWGRAVMSSWHSVLACLHMGLPRSFLYLCKAQAGEVESNGNTGIPRSRADIFW